jgi:glutathione synthase/RimK-type ligase-like ATP-grasp enzyme
MASVPTIGIVTLHEDLHAHVIRDEIRDRHGARCVILESDEVARSGALNWSPHEDCAPTLPVEGGDRVDVRELDAIWWRRPSGRPWDPSRPGLEEIVEPEALAVVRNDCLAGFQGVLLSEFGGVWVSHPDATRRAENKLVQLRVASQVGLRVPRTLVSQDPEAIRAFCARQPTIVKTLAGAVGVPLVAHEVRPEILEDDEALRLSPAIYQERIEGRDHLRVHVFGSTIVSAHLRCDELDWRIHLDRTEVEPHDLPADVERRLRRFMQVLDLRMGVFDIKIDTHGEMVWLEVNPQGQFLFIEGMSDMRLAAACGEFLYRTASERRGPREGLISTSRAST